MIQEVKRKLKGFAWRMKPYKYTLQKYLVKCKLIRGGNEFTKFVIITRSRTGSTLIDHSLRGHPHVISDGEILNWKLGRNINWIISNIYSLKPKKIKAVGFKIFYYHPQDDDSGEVWEILRSIDNLKVIHLKRKNKFATYLSRAIAGQTKVWSTSKNNNKQGPVKKITLDPKEIKSDFKRIEKFEKQFDEMFSKNDFLEVYYEELLHDFLPTIEKIQKFIEVPFHSVKSSLRKQGSKNLAEKVENYQELIDYFADTQWVQFFQK